MSTTDVLATCHGRGRVRFTLDDGDSLIGSFRTERLGPSAFSVYRSGDVRDMSLPIALIVSVDSLGLTRIAS